LKTNPNLVDKRQLDAKPEVIVQSLDRSLFLFSKRQVVVPSPGVTEFYTIKLKYPITEDNQTVTMYISPQQDLNEEKPNLQTQSQGEGKAQIADN